MISRKLIITVILFILSWSAQAQIVFTIKKDTAMDNPATNTKKAYISVISASANIITTIPDTIASLTGQKIQIDFYVDSNCNPVRISPNVTKNQDSRVEEKEIRKLEQFYIGILKETPIEFYLDGRKYYCYEDPKLRSIKFPLTITIN